MINGLQKGTEKFPDDTGLLDWPGFEPEASAVRGQRSTVDLPARIL